MLAGRVEVVRLFQRRVRRADLRFACESEGTVSVLYWLSAGAVASR